MVAQSAGNTNAYDYGHAHARSVGVRSFALCKEISLPALLASVPLSLPLHLSVRVCMYFFSACLCVSECVCLCTLLTLLRQPDKCCIQNAAQQLQPAHRKKLPLEQLLARRIQIFHCYEEACLGI